MCIYHVVLKLHIIAISQCSVYNSIKNRLMRFYSRYNTETTRTYYSIMSAYIIHITHALHREQSKTQ